MAFASDPREAIRNVVRALEEAYVPYMLTGSYASALHGTPRATQDIDVVIAPDRAGLNRLLDQFPEARYYVSREAATEAFEQADLFNIVDQQTGWKIDFIFRKPREFSRVEFDRRVRTDAAGFELYVASPEDTLLSKLEWARHGQSERQLRDAAGIIQIQGESLDQDYLRHWIKSLELDREWEAASNIAG